MHLTNETLSLGSEELAQPQTHKQCSLLEQQIGSDRFARCAKYKYTVQRTSVSRYVLEVQILPKRHPSSGEGERSKPFDMSCLCHGGFQRSNHIFWRSGGENVVKYSVSCYHRGEGADTLHLNLEY